MNVKIDKQEKPKIVVEFTMPLEEFKVQLNKAFTKRAKEFKVPGFRNGKVPRPVVEKYYGEEVLYNTVVDNVVDSEYEKVIFDNDFEVVSSPEFKLVQIGNDKDLIYTITFYILPEAKVEKYKGLEIDKINREITSEDIEVALDEARGKNARTISVEDRSLQNNDISTIDFEGFVDSIAFEGGKGENFELTIGSGKFIPGFEEQLIGMNIGDEKDINVKFPDDYNAEELAGKDAIFKVKLISIKAKLLPELDDEFAKDVSEFETFKEYKESIEIKLKEEKIKAADNEKQSKLYKKVIENTEVEIPEIIIKSSIDEKIEELTSSFANQGLTMELYCTYINKTLEELKESLRPDVIENLKLSLAFKYIIENENIKPQDSEIDEKIEELAKQHGSETTNIESMKTNEKIRRYVLKGLTEEKAIAIIFENAIEK
ncbi:MAG: trigger factor [Clostridia bacterium]